MKYDNLTQGQVERIAAILSEGKETPVAPDFVSVETKRKYKPIGASSAKRYKYIEAALLIADNPKLQNLTTDGLLVALHNMGCLVDRSTARRGLIAWKEGKV